MAALSRGDFLLCQITSQPFGDKATLKLTHEDFASGSLERVSYLRVGKLFTANESLLVKKIGKLKQPRLQQAIDALVALLKGTSSVSV